MAIKTFSTYADYIAAKTAGTVTAADTVAVKDNALTPVQVAALGKDSLVDTIRVSPISLKVAQFTAAEAKLNAQDKITVSDTAAVINSNLATLLVNAKVDSIAATGGSIELTVAQTSILANMAKIPASPISVVDSSANIQSKLGVLFANPKITSINSNEDGVAITLTPAQATNAINISKLQKADTIVVTGSNTAIQTNLDALLKSAKVDSIISDGGALKLTVAQATAANLLKIDGTSTLSVVDAGSAINSPNNAKLVALLANAKVDSINSTDDAAVPLKLNAAQAVAAIDAGTLVKIQSTDALTVVDSSANIQANLSKLLANAKIDSINSFTDLLAINLTADQVTPANMLKLQLTDNLAVVDTGANIQAKLTALLANPKIDSISTSDASALTLNAAAAVADSAAKISGAIAVSDTSAAINANLDALLADAKVTNINSTQDTTAITLTATQALVAANLDKLQAADRVVVALTSADSALTAEQITALNALVGGKVDSIQNAFTFAATTDALVAEGNGISFTVTSLIPVAADTTFTYSIQGNGANPTTASDLTPTSGTVKILAGQTAANFTINAINEGTAEFDEGAIVTLKEGTAVVGTQAFTVTDGASYTLTGPASATDEGSTATFTLNTVNVADDTVLTYTLSGTNIDASDIVGGSLTGTTTVMGGVATIDVQLASDLKTEGAETLKLTVEGKTANAAVNDTSLDATYTLVADQATANEGTNATFSLTSNAPAGSVVNYTLSGVVAADVTGGLLTGQVTLGAGGTATITVPLALDMLTEATPETVTVTVADKTASTIVVDKSFTPTLVNDTFQVIPGAAGSVAALISKASLLSNDIDSTGAVLTGVVSIVPNSEVNGTTTLNSAGDILFTPDAGQTTGSFQYSVDGVTGTATANVIFNTTPVATAGTKAVTEGTQATGAVAGTDADAGQTLTYTLVTGPTKGTLGAIDPATGAFTYDYTGAAGAVKGALAAGATDTDSFTFKVTDNLGKESATQTFTLTTTGINDSPAVVAPAPVAIDVHSGQGTGTGTGATPVSVDLSAYATDPDAAAGALTYALVGATTAHGGTVTLSGHTATISYPQNGGAGALGADSFNFTVTDGLIVTPVSATVNLNVTNTAPVASDVALGAKTGVTQTIDLVAGTSTQGSTVTTFTSGVSDADNNAVTPAIVAGSLSHGGSAEVINGKIVYTSTVGYTGTETLRYTLTDGFGGTSAEKTLTFTVASNTGGTSGDDLLYGSTAAENIDGLAGNDTIVGGGGLDTITGGIGNDVVTFSDAAAQVQGGSGVDTLVVNADAVASAWDLSNTSTQDRDANSKNSQNTTAVVRDFENIDASKASGSVSLATIGITSGVFDAAFTNAGTDTVLGTIDDLDGEAGDVAATTSVLTSAGNDRLAFGAATGSVTVNSNDGNDQVYVNTTATGKFSIDGGAGDDKVYVEDNNAANTVLGGAGNDIITNVSAASSDSIDGGAGNDSITGGVANETLLGGDGDDTIAAGTSTGDSIDGGAGTDTLLYSSSGGATAFTATSAAAVQNIELLNVTDTSPVTLAANIAMTTIDVDSGTNNNVNVVTLNTGYTNATTVVIDTGDTVTNTANVALTVTGSDTVFNGSVVNGGTGTTGTNDTLNIRPTDANTVSPAHSITTLTFSGHINDVDKVTVVDNGDDTSGTSIKGKDISLTLGAYGTALTIDASALDAGTLTGTTMGDDDETLVVLGASATKALNITGGAGRDSITGGTANDIINGNGGNDSILGSAGGDDSISGGTGNDTIDMQGLMTSGDTINGGDGTDTLIVTSITGTALTNVSNIETLAFNGSTTLTSNLSFTSIDLTNDALADTLIFGAGYTSATTVLADATDVVTNTANVALTVNFNSDDAVTVTGGTGADTLNVTASSSTVTTSGKITKVDTINVVDNGDATTGSTALAGEDITIDLTSYGTALKVDASALDAGTLETNGDMKVDYENLTITGVSATRLTVIGGAGADAIVGSNDATAGDSLSGGAGNDTFTMGANLSNVDTIAGGDGTDTITATTVTDTNFIKVSGVENLTLGGAATLSSYFDATGITTVNLHTTAAAADASGTGVGHTFVATAAVSETITGGLGNDTFQFGATGTLDYDDDLVGGTGTDTIALNNNVNATLNAYIDLSEVTGIEQVTLLDPNGDDTTTAEADAVAIYFSGAATGTTPADLSDNATDNTDVVLTVSGSVITDSLDTLTVDASAIKDADNRFSITGGAANDSLTGGASIDTISGGSGNDQITGGVGADSLTGGAGADKFNYALASSQSTNTATDTISDFTTGTDNIVISYNTTGAGGTTDFTNKGSAISSAEGLTLLSGSAATTMIGQYIYNSGTKQLILDADGNGLIQSTDMFVTLTGSTALASGDLNFNITTNNVAQTVLTGGGADTVTGSASIETITTGAGNDDITTGGTGKDTISSGDGDDIIRSVDVPSDLKVLAGAGTDTLVLSATGLDLNNLHVDSDDLVTEGGIEQLLVTAGGTTTLDGTLLTGDTLAINTIAAGDATIALGLLSAATNTFAGLSFAAVTYGTATGVALGNDDNDKFTVTLPNSANSFTGTSIVDEITGGTNVDNITAGSGNDKIIMGANLTSADVIDGGVGTNDTLTYTDDTLSTTELNSVTNVETITLGGASTSVVTVDGLVASGATLTVTGTATQTINWDGSAETNGAFNISAVTSAGNSTLTGGAGADTLTGGAGVDILTGNTGVDKLTGNASNDIFSFATGDSNAVVVSGNDNDTGTDTIMDWTSGDIIRVSVTSADTTWDMSHVLVGTATGSKTATGDVGSYLATTYLVQAGDPAATADGFDLAVIATSNGTAAAFGNAAAAQAATAVNLTGTAGGDTLTTGINADTITAGTGADIITGGKGTDTINLGAAGDIDLLKYSESGAVNVDTVSVAGANIFTVGTDTIGLSIGSIDNNGTNQTLSNMGGTDISATLAAGGFTSQVVAANGSAALADATNLIVLSTAATSFANAMGTASLTDTGATNTAGLGATEGVAAVWYDSTNNQSVYGYIVDSAAAGTALTSADTFVEIVRVGQASQPSTANLDLSLLAF